MMNGPITIGDYADILNADIELTRYCNQDGRWTAKFERCEVMENGCLLGAYGNDKSPEEALKEYVTKIRGRRIVFNAMDDKKRREFVVPSQLAA